MATVLVDFENVNAKDGLRGVQYLTEKDSLHIFYSESCRSIRTDYCETIMESQCQFGISKLINTGKNALDFYIACEAGIAAAHGEQQLLIISADKGFLAVSDFLQKCKDEFEMQVVIASSIEKALMQLNDPGNAHRKQLIKSKTNMIDIASVDKKRSRKELYTGCLHQFGRSEGLDIYHKLKDII